MRWEVWPFLLALWSGACSKGTGLIGGDSGSNDVSSDASDTSGKTGADESGSGGEADGDADEPTWINGSYLTCTWGEIAPDNIVQAGCGVASTFEASAPSALVIACATRDHGSGFDVGKVAPRDQLHVWLTIEAKLLSTADLVCTLGGLGPSSDRVLTQPLATLLPRANESAVQSCLMEQAPGAVRSCLADNRLALPAESGIMTEEGSSAIDSDSKSQQVLPEETTIVRYSFMVQIVTGSRTGQTYKGSFEYEANQLTGSPQETLAAQKLQFAYLSSNQPVPPGTLVFADGKFSSLQTEGSGFGINTGFDRTSFGRLAEEFVRNGDEYFGYLGSDGYLDGAGTITYTPP
jgi:hypothetical protein